MKKWSVTVGLLSVLLLPVYGRAELQTLGDIFDTMASQEKAKVARYARNLDSWRGLTINDLIARIGKPTGQYNSEDGNIVYEWLNSQEVFYPGDSSVMRSDQI
jgi:hypothetical protein